MSELRLTENGTTPVLKDGAADAAVTLGTTSVSRADMPAGPTGKPLPLRFPDRDFGNAQDTEWCEVYRNGEWRRLRLHDYEAIYRIPGLYERLFRDALRCCSPEEVVSLLGEVLNRAEFPPMGLRVLDLGAGNGMVGEELRRLPVGYLVGADILTEAAVAARRDRPGLYDDYVVADLTDPPAFACEALRAARLNCLVTVAALGFGDIPPRAFARAFNSISVPGWVALNIKETFFCGGDDTGFFRLLRCLWEDGLVQIEAMRRYIHRRSVDGKPLHYVALVARKCADVPEELVEEASEVGGGRPILSFAPSSHREAEESALRKAPRMQDLFFIRPSGDCTS
ncbi:MAG: hypothetical protein SFU56_14975 [Capsulimonadales bacterium]|nr:hypothetical protein [Capsulimonadales bacterium]